MAKSGGDNPFPLSEMMTQGLSKHGKLWRAILISSKKTQKASHGWIPI